MQATGEAAVDELSDLLNEQVRKRNAYPWDDDDVKARNEAIGAAGRARDMVWNDAHLSLIHI